MKTKRFKNLLNYVDDLVYCDGGGYCIENSLRDICTYDNNTLYRYTASIYYFKLSHCSGYNFSKLFNHTRRYRNFQSSLKLRADIITLKRNY